MILIDLVLWLTVGLHNIIKIHLNADFLQILDKYNLRRNKRLYKMTLKNYLLYWGLWQTKLKNKL
jgi:hypothetical protein